nr:hypothetical protein [Qipengyuania mesophila]
MGQQFPTAEAGLRDDIPPFVQDRTLGAILWHLSAIASLYDLSLCKVAEANELKITEISNRTDSQPTALYDRIEGIPEEQQFPLKFEISYVSTKRDRLQMFYRGRPLGDELDDNARTDDGYRFHDALHLANIAVLGWSPVMRSLMGLKRKYNPIIDRTEDGARARIVEEAIVKAVHSYAILIGEYEGLSTDEARRRLFTDAGQIPYHFLKLVRTFAKDLEVEKSRDWEWRKAIVAGHRLYAQLHEEKQGTVSIDLEKRQVTYSPMVIADVHGPVVDTAIEIFRPKSLLSRDITDAERAQVEAAAILRILRVEASFENLSKIKVAHSRSKQISVKAHGDVQEAIWERSIVGFRTQWTKTGRRWICLAMAIGVPS